MPCSSADFARVLFMAEVLELLCRYWAFSGCVPLLGLSARDCCWIGMSAEAFGSSACALSDDASTLALGERLPY